MSEKIKKDRIIWEQKEIDRIEIIPDIGVVKYLSEGIEKMFKYGDNRIEILGNSVDRITQ